MYSSHRGGQSRCVCDTARFLRLLHRTPGTYATWHTKNETIVVEQEWKDRGGATGFDDVVASGVLESAAAAHLGVFVSVNGMGTMPGRVARDVATGLVNVARTDANIVRFNACFADCDAGRLPAYQTKTGTDYPRLLADLRTLEAAGELPPASLLVLSGGGVWPLWLLQDPDGLPPVASSETRDVYRRVQEALAERLRSFKADAKDAARCMRVPGTVHRKDPSHPVTASFLELLPVRRYSLAEMASAVAAVTPFVVSSTPAVMAPAVMAPAVRRGQTTKPINEFDWMVRSILNGLRGKEARWDTRLGGLEALAQSRGIKEGRRNDVLWIVASMAARRFPDQRDQRAVLDRFNASCLPSMADADLRNLLNYANGKGLSKEQDYLVTDTTLKETIRKVWDLSDVEIAALPMFTKRRRVRRPVGTRSAEIARRRHLIGQIIEEQGLRPSQRQMVTLLAERGIKTSDSTVRLDYQALGRLAEPSASLLKNGLIVSTRYQYLVPVAYTEPLSLSVHFEAPAVSAPKGPTPHARPRCQLRFHSHLATVCAKKTAGPWIGDHPGRASGRDRAATGGPVWLRDRAADWTRPGDDRPGTPQ